MKIICKIFKDCYKHFEPKIDFSKYILCNCQKRCICRTEIQAMNYKVPILKDSKYLYDYNYEINYLFSKRLKK